MDKEIDYEKCHVCGESLLNYGGPTSNGKFGSSHLKCWNKKYGGYARAEFLAVQKMAQAMERGEE